MSVGWGHRKGIQSRKTTRAVSLGLFPWYQDERVEVCLGNNFQVSEQNMEVNIPQFQSGMYNLSLRRLSLSLHMYPASIIRLSLTLQPTHSTP